MFLLFTFCPLISFHSFRSFTDFDRKGENADAFPLSLSSLGVVVQ